MKNKYFDFFYRKTDKLIQIAKTFSLTEKLLFIFLIIVLIISTLGILIKVNNKFLISIPDRGGVLVEGIIGTPRFINPVIANSNADKDLTALIYSGLIRIDSNGQPQPDLAERFEISEDKLTYDFYLRENAKFHDGESVMADDIVFTILKIQDPEVRSPKITDWENIAIEKVSDRQIRFVLSKPDPNFLLKNNVGILPKHLWQEIPSEAFSLSLYNIEPIGSGPYKLSKVEKDTVDIPQAYILKSYKKNILEEPLIKKVIFKFAKNEEELITMINNGEINAVNSLSSTSLNKIDKDDFNIITAPLPRIFGIFINQTESPALSINSARQSLELATPKDQIIEQIFGGYAVEANGPIPNRNDQINFEQNLEKAEKILIDAGWKKNENGIYETEVDKEKYILSTSISTSNVPDLIDVAELIAVEWRKIGVEVSVKVFNASDLNQNVIRPRFFETLLFGNVIKDYSDLYAFWHSSRRNDPGLNITNYANIETDAILEKFANTPKEEISEDDVNKLISEIKKDIPTIFLYSPKFIYLISKDIQGININQISVTSDRFNEIHKWFINTDKVWKVFTR